MRVAPLWLGRFKLPDPAMQTQLHHGPAPPQPAQLTDEFANSLLPGAGLAGLREKLLVAQVRVGVGVAEASHWHNGVAHSSA